LTGYGFILLSTFIDLPSGKMPLYLRAGSCKKIVHP